jgi:hypothetical protein
MKRSIDALVSPVQKKKAKEDEMQVPPNAAVENEVIERRLANAYGTCRKTTIFLEFRQTMVFKLKVGAKTIHIQLIKTDQGVAQWGITRGDAWAVHHRQGMIISIGKTIEFNSLLIGGHACCNIIVPGGPAFAWKLSCCIGGPQVEKTQIH